MTKYILFESSQIKTKTTFDKEYISKDHNLLK